MSLDRRTLLTSALALSLPLPALSQRLPREGVDYKLVPKPLPNSSATHVDVVEFFQYTCPHCYAFQPVIQEWLKTKPADANFIHAPLSFDPKFEAYVRLYFTLEAMNLVERLHMQVFQAIHKDGALPRPPAAPSESVIADYMAKQGVDRGRWLQFFNSKEVRAKATTSMKLPDLYGVQGTPEIGVAGRYRTGPDQSRGKPSVTMLTVNYLVGVVRKSQGRG
ncbi:MAG: thiol:disulfide interchange protein DsbA/DsbL [Burkholderiales bacterium]|jgi:thiol:disulfide interchange protein DsbA|nr:thiol:disulfide interchange protein DsbA/DsbL [Burkholderiales bacterium]